ncbi:hypothetical protein AB1Y20_011107 [Prymnesium parvum]|uniref:N-acetyltransferase domain-containing protein n=1 Tax=Prymnesium parvum TaxID=97485 RepID=A0AB34INL5_PRYPA
MPHTVLNALGKPLPPAIKRILIKAQSSKVKPSPQTANANLCQAETNTSGNFWGDEPAAEAEINMLHAHTQPQYVDVDEAEAEAWLDQWRSTEVALAHDRNITLPLCHGTRELQEHTARGNDTWRLALRLGESIIGLVGAALYTSRRTQIISISQIYVIPDYRNQGIARHLISRILTRATAHGAKYMALGLGIREQRSTITFWTTYGFEITTNNRHPPTVDEGLVPITPSMATYDSFASAQVPECSHADASPSSSQRPHLVMIDGGSNVNLFSNADVPLPPRARPERA